MVENPLFDLSISHTLIPYLNIVFRQFRLPFGAAATTRAPQLNTLDRPTYGVSMTKAALRDIGFDVRHRRCGLGEWRAELPSRGHCWQRTIPRWRSNPRS